MTEPLILICMRLADMVRVHPEQIERNCARCDAVVGIYPSGQIVLQECPAVEIVCHRCRTPGRPSALAPGALLEPFQSKRRVP
jgi:hypothetical protein